MSEQDLDQELNICEICMEELNINMELGCGHVFHTSCGIKYIYKERCCPTCEVEIEVTESIDDNSASFAHKTIEKIEVNLNEGDTLEQGISKLQESGIISEILQEMIEGVSNGTIDLRSVMDEHLKMSEDPSTDTQAPTFNMLEMIQMMKMIGPLEKNIKPRE